MKERRQPDVLTKKIQLESRKKRRKEGRKKRLRGIN